VEQIFKKFEEIFPVYRDMGKTCKGAFEKARELDLFQEKIIKELEAESKILKSIITNREPLEKRLRDSEVKIDKLKAKVAKLKFVIVELVDIPSILDLKELTQPKESNVPPN